MDQSQIQRNDTRVPRNHERGQGRRNHQLVGMEVGATVKIQWNRPAASTHNLS